MSYSTDLRHIAASNQYLSLTLGDDLYGLPIPRVREVLEFRGATEVPRTPDFLIGVVNLRGQVIPVIDLKMRFEMGPTIPTLKTRVVIVELDLDEETTVLGMMADTVREVIECTDIGPPPKFGNRVQTDYVTGMGKVGEDFFIILDVERAFSVEELSGEIGEAGTEMLDAALSSNREPPRS